VPLLATEKRFHAWGLLQRVHATDEALWLVSYIDGTYAFSQEFRTDLRFIIRLPMTQ
jgi:hypothetical protein